MNNKKTFIIVALVVFITLYILYKVNTAARLDYQIGIPKQVSLKNGQLTFQLPMRIINPSGGILRLREMVADINSAGQYLGRATIDNNVVIAGRSETVININVRADYFDLVAGASSVWSRLKGGTVGLEIDGLLYAEGFQIPIKNSFDFTLPKL